MGDPSVPSPVNPTPQARKVRRYQGPHPTGHHHQTAPESYCWGVEIRRPSTRPVSWRSVASGHCVVYAHIC